MPELLFNLKNVPEDEYQEVCELLQENDIHYYQTHKGFWGLGTEAIWLKSDEQLMDAKTLLHGYMVERQKKAQENHQTDIEQGNVRTLFSTFKDQPMMFVLYTLAILVLVILTVSPFLALVD